MFGVDDVLTGGLSLLSGVANNIFAGSRQNDAQNFNAQQAAINRDWQSAEATTNRAFQERMSSTAHQREADDLQAAGLNRILGVSHGASSPSGNMGSGSSASVAAAPVHDMLGPAVNTAMAHARLKEEISNMKETNANIRANTRKSIIEGSKADDEAAKVRDERAIVIENLMDAKTKAERAKIEHNQLQSPAYKVLRQTGNVGEEVQRASSALGNLSIFPKRFNDMWKDRVDRGH